MKKSRIAKVSNQKLDPHIKQHVIKKIKKWGLRFLFSKISKLVKGYLFMTFLLSGILKIHVLPECIQNHGKQDKFAQERYYKWCWRDNLSKKQKEYSQWKQNADWQADLLTRIRRQIKNLNEEKKWSLI